MRKSWILILSAVLLCATSNASAVTMSDVGGYDDLLYSATDVGNSAHSEAAWVNSLLDTNWDNHYIDSRKQEDMSTASEMIFGDPDNDFGIELLHDPEHILVKTGGPTQHWWLFSNLDSPDWFAYQIGFDGFNIKNSGRISHIVELGDYEDNSDPVPEPTTLLLFGMGLIGLAGVSRKNES